MELPSQHRHLGTAIGAFVVGVLMIAIPLTLLTLNGEPFPGTVAQNSEVVPVLGLMICVISSLVIIQELFGY
ncbi:MAG TPA: hypothetical protein VKX96_08470 [Chloroflexota bacterium]|nr:hypothetical protein [Chloroflexota bacterium]